MRRSYFSRSELGEGKLLNLVWLSLAAAIVYFGVMWVPVLYEKWNVKSSLQLAANEVWKAHDAEKTRENVIAKLKGYNTEGKEPVFLLDTENIVVEEDEAAKTLTVRVTWTRVIPYPFLNKRTQKVFTQELKMSTDAVQW